MRSLSHEKAECLADRRRKAETTYAQYLKDGCQQIAEAYVKGLSNQHDVLAKLDACIKKAEARERMTRKNQKQQKAAMKKNRQTSRNEFCH